VTQQPSTKTSEFALADAQFAVCQRIEEFIGATVRPILDRASNGKEDHQTFIGSVLRVHTWLRSLNKLNHPGDFQAVLAGSRTLFEIAVDLTLLKFDPSCPCEKLLAWEESAKLHSVERLKKYCDAHPSQVPVGAPPMLGFVKRREHIVGLRRRYWKKDGHPSRWTGRSLEGDSIAADRFQHSGFEEYYASRYSQVCWNVHGSGLTGTRAIPTDHFPALSALGFLDATQFSLLACQRALQLLDRWDAITETRFELFREELDGTRTSVWVSHGCPK
jgi:hypothetical protein